MEKPSKFAFQEIASEELLGPLNSAEQKYDPGRLWIAGKKDLIDEGPRVAVVGSRNITDEGMKNTRRLTKFLTNRGVIIVSGLARGVDTIAHKTAIEEAGKTIAVLGTPINRCYPAENRMLQDQIMENYLAISQFPIGHPTRPHDFILRNRTMALICHASVIVEASNTSGSLSQGWEALRLRRPLFILQSVAENKLLTWPNEMVKYGASVISNLEEVFEVLPLLGFRPEIDVTQ